MRKNKLIVLSIMAVSVATLLSGCFGKKEEDDPAQVVVVETPTPAPTIAPAATATATPVPQITTYTSIDKSVSISLPNGSWSNRMDEGDTLSFESTDGDRILILHGEGEEAMSQAVLPDTRENASALTATSDSVEGTDFEITNYSASKVGDANVYTYTVNYSNTDKGGGYTAVANYVLATDDEFYSVAGSVKNTASLAGVQTAMKTFKVLNPESALAAATSSGTSSAAEKKDSEEKETVNKPSISGTTNAAGNSGAGAYSGMVLYNSEGVGFDIYSDGNGGYMDSDGNYFTMDENGDVYDEYGNYYSHSDYYEGNSNDTYNDNSGYDDTYYEDSSYDENYYDEDYYDDYEEEYYDYSYNNNYTGGTRDFVTSSGVAFGVYEDGYGNWIDGDGNTFTFDENGVAYDQYGNAYNPAW